MFGKKREGFQDIRIRYWLTTMWLLATMKGPNVRWLRRGGLFTKNELDKRGLKLDDGGLGLYQARTTQFMIDDPYVAAEILKDSSGDWGRSDRMLQKLIGDVLAVGLEDKELRNNVRAPLMTHFSRESLSKHAGHMLAIAKQTVNDCMSGDRVADICELTTLYTERFIFRLTLGVEESPKDVRKAWRNFALGNGSIALVAGIISKDLKRDLDTVHNYLNQLVEEEYAHQREHGLASGHHVLGTMVTKQLQSETLTRDQMIGILRSVLLAGHETTAKVLAWLLIRLGQPEHQDWHVAVHEECQDKFPDDPKVLLDERKIKEGLPVTWAVMSETMRQNPPAWGARRRLMQGSRTYQTFLGREVTFYEKDTALIDRFALHNSQAIWGKDAHEWNPQRFLDELTDLQKMSYHPFGVGALKCTGAPLAWMEALVFMRVLSSSGIRLIPSRNPPRYAGMILGISGNVPANVQHV